MPYLLTYRPRPPTGVKPTTITIETAVDAWKTYKNLTASDEKVNICLPSGAEIGWQELKMWAQKESS